MTWLERINNAEKRGRFTIADNNAIGSYETCLIGEFTEGYGPTTVGFRGELWAEVENISYGAVKSVNANDVAEVKRLYKKMVKLASTKRFKSAMKAAPIPSTSELE